MNIYALIQSIAWVLFHSLWIGIVVYLLAQIFIVRRSASVRYKVYVTILCVFVLIVGYKLTVEIDKVHFATAITYVDNNSAIIVRDSIYGLYTFKSDGFLKTYNELAIAIFGLWALISFIKLLRIFGNLRMLSKLKKRATELNDVELNVWMVQQRKHLKIERPVKLLQSSHVSSAIQIGHFTPCIVLPLSLLKGLSKSEVQAIILHELVHVANRDYLVNMIQVFLKSIFFFNPAFISASKSIDKEREFRCDDKVIKIIGEKYLYVKTLTHSYNYALSSSSLQMNFTDDSASVTIRVKRMLGQYNKPLNVASVITLASLWFLLYALNPDFISFPSIQVREEKVNVHQELYYHAEGCTNTVHKNCKKINANLAQVRDFQLQNRDKMIAYDLVKADVLAIKPKMKVELTREELVVNGFVHTGWIAQFMANKYLSGPEGRIGFAVNSP